LLGPHEHVGEVVWTGYLHDGHRHAEDAAGLFELPPLLGRRIGRADDDGKLRGRGEDFAEQLDVLLTEPRN
jgi:hypothetical protein